MDNPAQGQACNTVVESRHRHISTQAHISHCALYRAASCKKTKAREGQWAGTSPLICHTDREVYTLFDLELFFSSSNDFTKIWIPIKLLEEKAILQQTILENNVGCNKSSKNELILWASHQKWVQPTIKTWGGRKYKSTKNLLHCKEMTQNHSFFMKAQERLSPCHRRENRLTAGKRGHTEPKMETDNAHSLWTPLEPPVDHWDENVSWHSLIRKAVYHIHPPDRPHLVLL